MQEPEQKIGRIVSAIHLNLILPFFDEFFLKRIYKIFAWTGFGLLIISGGIHKPTYERLKIVFCVGVRYHKSDEDFL
jgi:hypothetical protein